MNNKIKMCFGLGAPSILMIFMTLCLTTLATLSLTTANSNYNLSKKSTEYVSAYYAADCAAEDWLCSINENLKAGILPESNSLIIPISENQSLEVIIDIENDSFEIVSQKVITTTTWEYEEPGFSDIITD